MVYVPDYYNVYKRQDVFRCVHVEHRKFSNVVSPWHVLEEKACFPEGCLSFYFRCARLMKGQRCPRRFHRPGRKCQTCASLREEKRHYTPEIAADARSWVDFRSELGRYKNWLRGVQGHEVAFFAKVDAVKPYVKHVYHDRRSQFLFSGYWILFESGYIGRDRFADRLYLYLPKGRQARWGILPGDELEGMAQADLHEGRLLLHHPRSLEFARRGEGRPVGESDILLGLNLGSLFPRQEERCFPCPQGVLVHVENPAGQKNLPRRELFCMAGFPSPQVCTHAVFSRVALEGCRRAS